MDTKRIMLIKKLKEWNWQREFFRFIYETRKVDDSITLVLTYHPALNQLYEILQRIHKHVLKLPRLHGALPSPSRVAFRNPKAMRDKLVRSKLKEFIYKDAGNKYVAILTVINVKYLKVEVSLKVRLPRKKCCINVLFDCNSCCALYSLTC